MGKRCWSSVTVVDKKVDGNPGSGDRRHDSSRINPSDARRVRVFGVVNASVRSEIEVVDPVSSRQQSWYAIPILPAEPSNASQLLVRIDPHESVTGGKIQVSVRSVFDPVDVRGS